MFGLVSPAGAEASGTFKSHVFLYVTMETHLDTAAPENQTPVCLAAATHHDLLC